jgi:hypothetical protein
VTEAPQIVPLKPAQVFPARLRRPLLLQQLVHPQHLVVVQCPEGQAEGAAAWLLRALEDGMADWLDPVPVTVEVTVGGTWGQLPDADSLSPPYAGNLLPGGAAGRHGGRSGVPDLPLSLAGGRSAMAVGDEGHAGEPAAVPPEGEGPPAGLECAFTGRG